MNKGPSTETLNLVWERAGRCCERCGAELTRGAGGYSIHHRRLKGQGGDRRPDTQLAANLLLLCGSGTTGCHGIVHHEQLEARREGFIVSRWADPEQVGVMTGTYGWVLLDNEGGLEPWAASTTA